MPAEKSSNTSGSFELVPVGEGKLYLPRTYTNPEYAKQFPHHYRPTQQEMEGQKEVFGTDGHGAIRNEESDYRRARADFRVGSDTQDGSLAEFGSIVSGTTETTVNDLIGEQQSDGEPPVVIIDDITEDETKVDPTETGNSKPPVALPEIHQSGAASKNDGKRTQRKSSHNTAEKQGEHKHSYFGSANHVEGGIREWVRMDTMLENERRNQPELRINTAEVQVFNDRAQFEIYGSHGRTLVGEDGNIVADKQNPMKGKLQEIRDDTTGRYGRTEAERNQAAKSYEDEVQRLTESGIELSQAKMIMDLREADRAQMATEVQRLISGGKAPQEAIEIAAQTYDMKDRARVKFIRENDVYSIEEYNNARKRNSAKTPNSTGQTPEKKPESGDVLAIPEQLTNALNRARDEYARLTAGISRRYTRRRGIRSGEFDADSVEDARWEYIEARNEAGAAAAELMRNAGMSEVEIAQMATVGAINEINTFANTQMAHKLAMTGRYEITPNGLQEVEPTTRRGRAANRFYDWWARNSDGRGRVKKGAVMGGLGSVTGLAVRRIGKGAFIFVPGGAGALIATRIATHLMSGHIERRGMNSVVAGERARALSAEMRDRLMDLDRPLTTEEMTHSVEWGVTEEIRNNKRRLAVLTGSMILGSLVGNLARSWIHGNNSQLSLVDHKNAPTSTTVASTPKTIPRVLPKLPAGPTIPATGSGFQLGEWIAAKGEGVTQVIKAHDPGYSSKDYYQFFLDNKEAIRKMNQIRPMRVIGGLGIKGAGQDMSALKPMWEAWKAKKGL